MKLLITLSLMWFSIANLQAQSISLHTSDAVSVSEILVVSGDTFASRQGVWIYTWSKEGKKINTRAAK